MRSVDHPPHLVCRVSRKSRAILLVSLRGFHGYNKIILNQIFREVLWEGLGIDWIDRDQDRERWWAVVYFMEDSS